MYQGKGESIYGEVLCISFERFVCYNVLNCRLLLSEHSEVQSRFTRVMKRTRIRPRFFVPGTASSLWHVYPEASYKPVADWRLTLAQLIVTYSIQHMRNFREVKRPKSPFTLIFGLS